jgi:signal transduction histidine kinase
MSSAAIAPRRIADAAIAVMVLALVGDLVLKIANGRAGGSSLSDWFFVPIVVLGSALYAGIGRVIVARQPRNTIGWLLLAIPLAALLSVVNGSYATRALLAAPGSLPFGVLSAWIDRWALVGALAMFIPIFLLYPDGRLPSERWRWVLVATVTAPVVTVAAFALTPGRLTGAFADLTSVRVDNPLGIGAPNGPIEALTLIGGFATLLTAVAAGVAIIVRFRRADPEVRQQIRWLAVIAMAFFAFFLIGVAGGDNEAIGNTAFLLMFVTLVVGIPVACGIAILRYRLWDLGVVIRKAVIFTLVAGTITLGALVVVLVVPVAVLGIGLTGWERGLLVLGVALGATIGPLRRWARRVADRIVFGRRATPYEVLTAFSERLGETYATDDVLPRMARILAEATGADIARVYVRVGPELRAVAVWPEGAKDDPAEFRLPVLHQGEDLGALAVTMPANDPMDPGKEKLVRDLAGQAGLVLSNVRLIEELRASRQRLVSAQDEERRRIERNLHDGAQQQLVALSVKVRLARQLTARDPAKAAGVLDEVQTETGEALETLRDLARGIYPPLLADEGLVAALGAQARRSPVPVTVEADGIGRYPREVEAAVYFCTLEALNNVAKYARATTARVELAQTDGHLVFTVTDDGIGFDRGSVAYGTGMQGMADRLDAIGGSLEVRSVAGAGTTLSGRVPVQ